MSTSQICILLTIVVYLVAMVLVGVYCSRKAGATAPTSSTWAAGSWPHRHRMSAEART